MSFSSTGLTPTVEQMRLVAASSVAQPSSSRNSFHVNDAVQVVLGDGSQNIGSPAVRRTGFIRYIGEIQGTAGTSLYGRWPVALLIANLFFCCCFV